MEESGGGSNYISTWPLLYLTELLRDIN